MKYGFPGMDNIRSYSDYVLSYDRRNRVAHWTFEHLTPQSVEANENVNRSKSDCEFHFLTTNMRVVYNEIDFMLQLSLTKAFILILGKFRYVQNTMP